VYFEESFQANVLKSRTSSNLKTLEAFDSAFTLGFSEAGKFFKASYFTKSGFLKKLAVWF